MSFPVQIHGEPEGITVEIVDQRIGANDLRILIDADGQEWTPVSNTNDVRPLDEGEGTIDRDRPAAPDAEQVSESEAGDVKGTYRGLDRVEGDQPDPTATELPAAGKETKKK